MLRISVLFGFQKYWQQLHVAVRRASPRNRPGLVGGCAAMPEGLAAAAVELSVDYYSHVSLEVLLVKPYVQIIESLQK